MNYHNITMDDMVNGEGLRTTLFVSGCEHRCYGCQNPQTHSLSSGILFDNEAKEELMDNLKKDYISGVTFSGGDPFHPKNRKELLKLCKEIKTRFPEKTIWVYTGYRYETLCNELAEKRIDILNYIDVMCDGKFYVRMADANIPWVGSSNQRVIDVKKTIKSSKEKMCVVSYNSNT